MSMFLRPAPLKFKNAFSLSLYYVFLCFRIMIIMTHVPPAVKQKRDLLSPLLPVEPLQHVDEEPLHVLHFFLSLDMFEHAEHQQFVTVFVSKERIRV